MSASVAISELERRTLAKVKGYMLVYIVIGQLLYQFNRSNIGFAQLSMGKEVALTAEAFGLASGVIGLSAFLMQVPAGYAFEKFGARRWLTFIMVAWGLVVVLQSFVTNAPQLIILRFFVGVFEAGFLPGVIILISMWFRGKDQGVAQSFVMIGLGLSGVIGGPFAGWILGKHYLGLSGWRCLFLIDGVLAIAWALISLFILQDSPLKAAWLKPDEREFMVKYLGEYQAQKTAHGALETKGMWSAAKDLRIFFLIISYGCASWIAATFNFFTPTLLKTVRAGVSNQYVGWLAAGPSLVILVLPFFWGRHGDKTERHWHTVLPLLVCVAGILLYPVARVPLVAMLCLCLVQAGNSCYNVNFWPSCNMVVGRQTIVKTTTVIHVGNYVGQLIAPIYFGWAKDVTGNTKLGLYTGAGVMLFNFVIMNVFFFRYKRQQKQQAYSAVAGTN